MSNHIDKDDPNRWFYVKNANSGEESLVVFGNAGEQFVTEVETGESALESYLTENQLENAVNTIANDNEYYQNSIETESSKFQQPSGLYVFGLRSSNP